MLRHTAGSQSYLTLSSCQSHPGSNTTSMPPALFKLPVFTSICTSNPERCSFNEQRCTVDINLISEGFHPRTKRSQFQINCRVAMTTGWYPGLNSAAKHSLYMNTRLRRHASLMRSFLLLLKWSHTQFGEQIPHLTATADSRIFSLFVQQGVPRDAEKTNNLSGHNSIVNSVWLWLRHSRQKMETKCWCSTLFLSTSHEAHKCFYNYQPPPGEQQLTSESVVFQLST